MWKPRFKATDVVVSSSQRQTYAIFSVAEYAITHPTFSGGTQHVSRVCCERAPAVVVLPYDPIRDVVVMVEQFRVGAMAGEPWLLECVAGMIDPHESPRQAAERELYEEVGLQGQNWRLIAEYYVSPGGSNEQVFLWQTEVDATQVRAFGGVADEQEDIQVHALPWITLQQALEQGQINNSASLIALQGLALSRLAKNHE